jgi:hypothetical protein
LSDTEVLPNAKRLAAQTVQHLTTYDPGSTVGDLAAGLAGGRPIGGLDEALEQLHHPGAWSRGQILYPQLGGATDVAVSVMVVVEQVLGFPDGQQRHERRTLDVRLALVEGTWSLDQIASSGGAEAPEPDGLSPNARAVLSDERIHLPDTARWDIHRGRITEELLALMVQMAVQRPYRVAVLDTGHPWEVFGTLRQSAHTRGAALDVYAVDGTQVIDDRVVGGGTHDLVRWLFSRPDVRRIGSPWALDGYGQRSFTDLVHQDHVHVEVVVHGR